MSLPRRFLYSETRCPIENKIPDLIFSEKLLSTKKMNCIGKIEKSSLGKKANKTLAFAILGLALFLGSILQGKAQDKIDTYSMSSLQHYKDKGFDISLNDGTTLWIDVFSTYKPGEKVGFKLNADLLPDFINTSIIARDQYTMWKEIAIEKNMQNIKQKMDLIFYTEGYFSFLNEIKTDNNVKVIFAFTYFKGDYVLIINLDKMTASDNELAEFDGASIVFNSEKEIDSFLSKISQLGLSSKL